MVHVIIIALLVVVVVGVIDRIWWADVHHDQILDRLTAIESRLEEL